MKYEWRIEFEAEDDADAKDVIYNDQHGAIQSFENIHDDILIDSNGTQLGSA